MALSSAAIMAEIPGDQWISRATQQNEHAAAHGLLGRHPPRPQTSGDVAGDVRLAT